MWAWFTFPRVVELILAVWVIICEVIFLFFFMNSGRRRVGVLSGPPKVYYDLSDLSNRYNEAYNISTIAIIFVVVRLVDFFRVNQALSIFVAVFYKVRYMCVVQCLFVIICICICICVWICTMMTVH